MRFNSLILQGPRDKDACIRKCPELTDGEVKELLAPWRGEIEGIQVGTTGEEVVK